MLGDRTDPHRFAEWDSLTSRERSGQCMDLIQETIRRFTDMQKALVRKQRSDGQQYALARASVLLRELHEINNKLKEEITNV